MSKPNMVYVTRYALTDGIRRCAVRSTYTSGRLCVVWPGASSYGIDVDKEDAHDTLDAAQARAKEMARKKLKSLAKQAAKLEKIAALGVKVHDAEAS
ncbi:hypothetical protein [Sorangium sp. So ce388]|uniref:hypothetical protein n=1 Tax=Sorangium sp. So ce388 TaxID=3133309 RepID=UPI003F5C4DEA